MAKPSIGVSAPASSFFTPAFDQSTVDHIKVTVQSATPKPDGSVQLSVTSGNVGFDIVIDNLPGRPGYKTEDRLRLEYPKGHNPMTAPYSAIYHADKVSKVSQPPLSTRSKSMSAIVPFNFENNTIRVVPNANGDPQFVAKDVADALGYAWNATKTVGHVPDEWRGVESVSTPSGMQEMIVFSEQGLYFFLGRSDKPGALPMQKWIAGEVLPSIRKTGSYSVKGGSKTLLHTPHQIATDALKLVPVAIRAAKAFGLDKNAAAISANQAVLKITGTNVLALMDQTQIEADRQDTQWFTPTELGQRINVSARSFNLLLAEAGLQLKRGEVWEVTDAGREFARLYDTGKKHGSGVPVQQIKWSPSVLPLLEKEAA